MERSDFYVNGFYMRTLPSTPYLVGENTTMPVSPFTPYDYNRENIIVMDHGDNHISKVAVEIEKIKIKSV